MLVAVVFVDITFDVRTQMNEPAGTPTSVTAVPLSFGTIARSPATPTYSYSYSFEFES
jgi:hypothetical protein